MGTARRVYNAARSRVHSHWPSTLEPTLEPTVETHIGANTGVSHWSPHRGVLQWSLTLESTLGRSDAELRTTEIHRGARVCTSSKLYFELYCVK